MSNFLLRASIDDEAHAEAQRRTGFWGARGAGIMLQCRTTGRFLIGRRSAHVDEPGTWNGWGGAIDQHETPLQGAIRELREEAGIKINKEDVQTVLYVYRKQGFTYTTFFASISTEVRPKLTRETSAAGWFALDDLPTPFHFGLKAILQNKRAQSILQGTVHV